MPVTFKTSSGEITLGYMVYDGNPIISVTDYGDAGTDISTASIHLDNYQAYKLAMELLKGLEVVDKRGCS